MYAWPANKYVLSGYQHDQDGNTLVQFHGDEVHLCGSKFARPCIKFEWNSSPVYERNQFSGYTFMDSGIFEKDKFEGEGFLVVVNF